MRRDAICVLWRICATIAACLLVAGFVLAAGCTSLGYKSRSDKDGSSSRDIHVTTTKPAAEIVEMVKGGVGSAVDFLGPVLTSVLGGGIGVGGLVGWLNSRASKSREQVRKEAELRRAEEYNAGLVAGAAARAAVPVVPVPVPTP